LKIESDDETKPKLKSEPAAVVDRSLSRKDHDVRLWAFGYDMSNKKARCWYESTMPIILCPDEHMPSYEFHVASLVKAADFIAKATRDNLKRALFKRKVKVRGDLSFITGRFWQTTEAQFFDTVRDIQARLVANEDVLMVLERWARLLGSTADRIFDDVSQTGAFDAADPKRIALAWRGLRRALDSKKFRETLGLPRKPTTRTRSKGGMRRNV
jgi:CRISPR system Cascade subunit CasA